MIALDEIPANTNFQVEQDDTRRLYLTGTTDDVGVADIQARILNADGGAEIQTWDVLDDLVIGGGVWSGSLVVPMGVSGGVGVLYNAEVRTRDGGGSEISSDAGANDFGAGDNTLAIGSSSSQRWATEGTPAANPLGFRRNSNGTWELFETAGTGQAAAAHMLAVQDGGRKCPQGWLNYGDGGTDMSNWTNPAFVTLVAAIAAARAAGIRRVIWTGGINSARKGHITSKAAHKAQLLWIRDYIRAQLGIPDLPFFINMSQKCLNDDYDNGPIDWQFDVLRETELECHDEDNRTYLASCVLDLPVVDMPDGLHLSANNMEVQAERAAVSVLFDEGLSNWNGRGPSISSIVMDSSNAKQVEAFFAFPANSPDTNCNPNGDADSITQGWVNQDDATNPITSTARGGSPQRFAFNHTNNIPQAPLSAYTRITYGAGAHPSTEGAQRSRGNTSALPLEPHSGYVDPPVGGSGVARLARSKRPLPRWSPLVAEALYVHDADELELDNMDRAIDPEEIPEEGIEVELEDDFEEGDGLTVEI
jgi:hypothetical protein